MDCFRYNNAGIRFNNVGFWRRQIFYKQNLDRALTNHEMAVANELKIKTWVHASQLSDQTIK